MSLFEMERICPKCKGTGQIFSEKKGVMVACKYKDYHAPLPDPGRSTVGYFHSGADDTERNAAFAQVPKSGTDRRRVLDFLLSVEGATDEEISLKLGMRLYTAAPRRFDLVKDGWVEDSGERRATTTGTDAKVWRVTAQGRLQAEEVTL